MWIYNFLTEYRANIFSCYDILLQKVTVTVTVTVTVSLTRTGAGTGTNRTPASRSSYFVNHSTNYRPNWTPLGPINIIIYSTNKMIMTIVIFIATDMIVILCLIVRQLLDLETFS